jgi:hypothetical protein
MTNRLLLFFVAAIEWLCPVFAVRFARAFGGITAFERFTMLGENAMADRLRCLCYFFGSSFDAKISWITVVLNRSGMTSPLKPSAAIFISS